MLDFYLVSKLLSFIHPRVPSAFGKEKHFGLNGCIFGNLLIFLYRYQK